jgi:hypothetical protein
MIRQDNDKKGLPIMVKAVRKGLAALALGLVFAPALIIPAAQAQSGEALFSNVLSTLGITAPDKPDINYRDRPPLVVPPRSTLPPPQEERRNAANWPNDPDSAENRRARAAEAGARAQETSRRNWQPSMLTPDQIRQGRTRSGTGGGMARDRSPEDLYDGMAQIQAANARQAQKEAELPVGQEPPRRFLTEPPEGLRAATQRVRATSEPIAGGQTSNPTRSFIDGR